MIQIPLTSQPDRRLCVCVIYDRRNRPLIAGIRETKSGLEKVIPLYQRDSNRTIAEVEKSSATIREIVSQAINSGLAVVTSGFKTMLKQFEIPLCDADYRVYDVGSTLRITDKGDNLADAVSSVLDKYASCQLAVWQKLVSNAAVVYQALENRGIYVGGIHYQPEWSMETFSGRSKTTGFNVHGLTDEYEVRNPDRPSDDLLLHFDWVAADIRVAAILSGDATLSESFKTSDPYQVMSDLVSVDGDRIERDECKQLLLKAINSLNTDGPVFKIFPDLGAWLVDAAGKIDQTESLSSIYGRKFRLDSDRNKLSLINAAFQGSVAHGMNNILKQVWDRFGMSVMFDTHDSLVVSTTKDNAEMTIVGVVDVMRRPLPGLDEVFPVKVSVGRNYGKWRYLRTYR